VAPNRIHSRVLKELANVITRLVFIIFQWSWESGEVPIDWKLANVVPVFRRLRRKTLVITGHQFHFSASKIKE